MPSHRFPILVWEHFTGGFTACLVEDHNDVAAVAPTRAAAVLQIKDLLQWRYRQMPWLPKPDFVEPELNWVKVEVRAEYTVKDRLMPCRETSTLRVACVRGKNGAGLLQCALPTLGIRFDYDEEKSLSGLVGHYVQTVLKGSTPQQLARNLPPGGAELDDVVILVPKQLEEHEKEPDVEDLSAIAEPLGARAARSGLSRPWERDEQVNKLVGMLAGEQTSVLLVGESGCGKTAALMEAVRKAERQPIAPKPDEDGPAADNKPQVVRKRFWLTSGARLIAGMQYLGQWQQRCEAIIAELAEIQGVLCVESLLDLVRTGGEGPNDSVAAFLTPYLQRGELRLVGEATPAELDACRRLLPTFASLFSIVEIPPFSAGQAISALEQLAGSLRQNSKVECERSVIQQVYRLFSRFMPYQSFPGKAAAFTTDLFDRAGRAKIAKISDAMVIDRFVKITGLPELFLRDERILRQQDVVDAFSAKVIGQPAACRQAAGVITTFKAGLNDPARPLGVLLFCGPTGVGKTELAKAISQYLFGYGETGDRMARLDMSEYSGPGGAERIVGAPDGEPSDLIKRLRQQPFTVLLFDEIEKAAPEVFDMLLGVFDEGRLTDRFGRLTTFRSALIIMTSNLGADRMTPFGLSKQPGGTYNAEAMSFFRPEFFNRIDAVVTFDALGESTVRQIAVNELGRIAKREGLASRGITLEWSDAVVELLVKRGYDARYGARPLQRAIEELIVTPLARFLINSGKLRDCGVGIQVDDRGTIAFEIEAVSKSY